MEFGNFKWHLIPCLEASACLPLLAAPLSPQPFPHCAIPPMCLFHLCTLCKTYSLRTCNMPVLCWHWDRENISQVLFLLSREVPSIKPVEPLVLRNSNSEASPQHSPYFHTPMGTWFLLWDITSFKSLSSGGLVFPVHWGGHRVYKWVFYCPLHTRLTISFQYPLPVSVSLGCHHKVP